MPVDGYPRHAGHAEAHRDVACDHAATLQGLREDEVVEIGDRDLGPFDCRADGDLGELVGVH